MLLRGLVIMAACALAGQSAAEEFDYIDGSGNVVTTTHEAAYRIKIDSAFQPLGELHHRRESNGHMFRISFSAFSNGPNIILVHAETLAEPSGILSYEHLPQLDVGGVSVGVGEQCIPVEAKESLSTNPEAEFVRQKGFTIELPFLLTQHFIASESGNAEIAIAFGQPIDSCEAVSEAFRADTLQRMTDVITLKQIDH